MKYVNLSNTDIKISQIALGCDYYGTDTQKETANSLLDNYVFLGGNVIDTARNYGRTNDGEYGYSEKVIGEWLKHSKKRNEVFLSTKGGHSQTRQCDKKNITLKNIMLDIEASLKSMGTEYVDIFWLHRDDLTKTAEELAEILDEVVKRGYSRFVGVSNWSFDRIEKANKASKNKIIAGQIQFNMAKPNMDNIEKDLVIMNQEEFSKYSQNKMNVFAFSSQAKGFFQKMCKGKENLSKKAYDRYFNEKSLENFELLKEYGENHGFDSGQASLGALMSIKKFNVVPIIGCRNVGQLENSLKSVECDVDEKILIKLLSNCLV